MFPSLISTTDTAIASATTSHAVNLPTAARAGDLLLMHFVSRNGTHSVPSGWTSLDTGTAEGLCEASVFYKESAGSESSTVTVTTSSSVVSCAQVHRICQWNAVSLTASTTAADTAMDAPNHTPAWGAKDTLWLVLSSAADDEITLTASPPGYSSPDGVASGAGTDAGCYIASSHKTENVSAENPSSVSGAYGVTAQDQVNYTLSVEPGDKGRRHAVIEGTANTAAASASTVHSVSLPSGIQADELLLMVLSADGNATGAASTPSGWTEHGYTNAGGFVSTHVFYKQASGSEGSSVSVTLGASRTLSAICYRISAWESVEGSTRKGASSGTTLSSNTVTPTWGADDTLWIALFGTGDDDETMTGAPSDFDGLITLISGGGTNNGPSSHTAWNSFFLSENTATGATISAGEAWNGWIMAVEPGTKGVGSGSAIAPLSYHHRFHNLSG